MTKFLPNGQWALERTISDPKGRKVSLMEGVATWTSLSNTESLYHETVQHRHKTGKHFARQKYLYRLENQALSIYRSNENLFATFKNFSETTFYHCGQDTYQIRFARFTPTLIEQSIQVIGPKKEFQIETTLHFTLAEIGF